MYILYQLNITTLPRVAYFPPSDFFPNSETNITKEIFKNNSITNPYNSEAILWYFNKMTGLGVYIY